MASLKEKLTKYTAYYRCPDDIRNLKLRVKYKQIDADKVETAIEDIADDWGVKNIAWQQKHFNRSELEFYRESANCVTDLEKKYHQQIREQNNSEEATNIFTYVEQDGYTFEQEVLPGKETYLQALVESSNITKEDTETKNDEFDYNKSLEFSIANGIITHNFEKMYIMVDLGEYVGDIWIKNEQLICCLKFDRNSKVLSVYPDFTTTKPYRIKILSETVRYFYFFIENCSELSEELALKEKEIIKKISEYKNSIRKRIIGDRFPMPPKNKLAVYLFLEILSAKNFEYSDVYVQYFIDLPVGWSCEDPEKLMGETRTSHGTSEEFQLHFSHCFDVVLHYDLQKLNETGMPKTPYIYFEVISKDSWDRYRTEGLTYRNLPISEPGLHYYDLSCLRFNEGAYGNLKRFFIGDCRNYKDVTWIGVPTEHENVVINKFGVNTLGTGSLNIRLNVVHQSQAFLSEFSGGNPREKFIYEKLNSSSLIKSVEEVVQAFRKARKNMLEVRKKL